MEIQIAGPILALVTFLTVWWGHVLVRITHYYLGTKPAPVLIGLGLLTLLVSTQVELNVASAAMGIIGITLIWDSFELHRQEARVRLGHAPLNPRVHRKAAGILAANLATEANEGDEGMCLSCGSNPNTRFLCRKGPYCKVRHWERYGVATPEAESTS